MLSVSGGRAQFERELIRIRTGEGERAPRRTGKSAGRNPKFTLHQKQEAGCWRVESKSIREIERG